MLTALEWAAKHKVVTESSYPYTGKDGTCKAKTGDYQANRSAASVTRNSQSALMSAIKDQPISVGIEADKLVF